MGDPVSRDEQSSSTSVRYGSALAIIGLGAALVYLVLPSHRFHLGRIVLAVLLAACLVMAAAVYRWAGRGAPYSSRRSR